MIEQISVYVMMRMEYNTEENAKSHDDVCVICILYILHIISHHIHIQYRIIYMYIYIYIYVYIIYTYRIISSVWCNFVFHDLHDTSSFI